MSPLCWPLGFGAYQSHIITGALGWISGGPVQGHTPDVVDNEAHGQSHAASCVYHEASGDASRPSVPLRLDRTLHPVCADYEALGNAIRTSCPLIVDLVASGNACETPSIMRRWVTPVILHKPRAVRPIRHSASRILSLVCRLRFH